MEIARTDLDGVWVLTPVRRADDRGWFAETYTRRALAEAGFDKEFVQDNHAYSRFAGTVRGLHFQAEPFAQDKLVRCVRGAALDVVLDIRRGSPTFGRHARVSIDAEGGAMVLIPAGFAHGFCTTAPDTEIVYKVTNYYAPAYDRAIRWNDPALGIEWPLVGAPHLSERDAQAPLLAELDVCFRYGL